MLKEISVSTNFLCSKYMTIYHKLPTKLVSISWPKYQYHFIHKNENKTNNNIWVRENLENYLFSYVLDVKFVQIKKKNQTNTKENN